MSLLLLKGWNVATPEIDTGDDILVLKDESGDLRKIQVKSTYTILKKKNQQFQVKFNVPGRQLTKAQPIELTYFFVLLKNNVWHNKILIIERTQLEYQLSKLNKKLGSGNINFYLTFSGKKVFSTSKNISIDLVKFVNDYSNFPTQF
ncbi:MAG: hypothetical protein HY252_00310 [Sphingobacteriales bacterium]|nr:hypothetical protein [Sphingobacteriales bacterium]